MALTGHSPVEKLAVLDRARWFDADESHYTGLKGAATVAVSIDYTLPGAGPAANGQILAANTDGTLYWMTPASGGSGEVNTSSNAGSGAQVAKAKSGVDLPFRTLVAGGDGGVIAGGYPTPVSAEITQGVDEITIAARGVCPVGSVLPWLKSHGGNPYTTLPTGWVEANGQTITGDAASPFNNRTLPNLNNHAADASHAAGRNAFLRGGLTSGGVGGSETHYHPIVTQSFCDGTTAGGKQHPVYSATNDASTLPSYYQVVWIIRIK